jgi:hypothetical protein
VGRTAAKLGLLVAVGLWPMLYVLNLAPVSRDEVLWITRGAYTSSRWWDWVLAQSHFVGYRPVTALSYTLDSLVGGFHMLPYRATDLLLHAFAAVMVYLVYRRLTPRLPAWGGLVSVAFFLAHPVTALVVPHLARRSYSLATALALLGVWVLLGPARRGRELWGVVALAAAALSNEAAIVAMPAAALAVGLREGGKAGWRVLGLTVGAGVLLLGARLSVLGGMGGYEVEKGSRWALIVASTWKGLFGLGVMRSGTEPLPDMLAALLVFAAVSGLVLPMFARDQPLDEGARGSLVAWAWLVAFTVVYLPQGVFFPRQLYMPLAPLALLLGIAAAEAAMPSSRERRWALLGALTLCAAAFAWQSPVLRGPDPMQYACWRKNDALVREMEAKLTELPPRAVIHTLIPYYDRPDIEALRAHDEEDSRMVGKQTLTWITHVYGLKFAETIFVSADPRSPTPQAFLHEPEGEPLYVTLPPGGEVVKASSEAEITPGPDGVTIRPQLKVHLGRPAFLFFHDGLSSQLVTLVCSDCGESGFQSRADVRYPHPPVFPDGPVDLEVASDGGDGTRSAGQLLVDGREQVNRAGDQDQIVLTFDPPDEMVQAPLSAHLVLPVVARGGRGPVSLRLSAEGADSTVEWSLPEPWPDPFDGMPARDKRTSPLCAPLQRRSPELAPLLRELAGRPGWAGHPLEIVIEAVQGELLVHDFQDVTGEECGGRLTPRLELLPTLRSALAGKELLSRPTDRSVTLTVWPRIELELAVEYWPQGGEGARQSTEILHARADEPALIELAGLSPGTAYRYRLRYRLPGGAFEEGPERTFHTQRGPGEPFVFTVSADVHLLNMEQRRAWSSMHLLRSTLERAAQDEPDFHLDLGDSFNGESYRSYDAPDDEEMLRRYLEMRPYFEAVDAPLFAVLGNHEGEQGWRLVEHNPLPDRSLRARRALFPNPTGGDAENYYAFQWGDVLVVALDPYRYTERKPHRIDGGPGSGDRWDWTLGRQQYDWLVKTLEESQAPFKLVVSHQVTGGTNDYGRGGRLAAKSYEWGAGPKAFAKNRPGWERPIHKVLADTGVTAFLHGHDHVFAFEPPLDGVAYITVPQPGDAQYDQGHGPRSELESDATVVENSGYLRFTSSAGSLRLEYVRSFLPGDGTSGEVAFTHEFKN